jgi:hypothetical protein
MNCRGLLQQEEDSIPGIYMSATVNSPTPEGQAICSYVHPLSNSRLDTFDFPVTDVLSMLSPVITTEILVYLLAQRYSTLHTLKHYS